VTVCLLAVVLPVSTGVGSRTSQSEYDLTVDGAIETPERTVTIEGEDYTLRSVGAVDPGDDIVADITAPSDAVYDVELRNADEQVVSELRMTDSGTVTFDTGNLGLDPGTYAVVVLDDQHIETLRPVVVSGYELTVDPPASVAPGESAEITVDVTDAARNSAPEGVEVVAYRGDEVIRVSATETATQQYTATVPFDDDSPTGEYTLYALAKGEKQLSSNYQVSLAVDNGATITVDETAGDGGDDDGNTGGSVGGGTEQHNSDDEDDNGSESTDSDDGNASETNDSTGDDESTGSANHGAGDDAASDGTDVLAPSNRTSTNQSGDDQSVGLLAVLLAFAAILLSAIARNRSTG